MVVAIEDIVIRDEVLLAAPDAANTPLLSGARHDGFDAECNSLTMFGENKYAG
jgi:hypothetical protein